MGTAKMQFLNDSASFHIPKKFTLYVGEILLQFLK